MSPILLHIWGPISIHAYGVCIAVGIILAFWLMSKDTKTQTLLPLHDFATVVQWMVVSGYLGGRILCLATEDFELSDLWLIVQFWEPGLSILGCIIGILITLLLFLWYKKIPILQLTDRISVYSPLVQSFGRLGCFFAGCCYGMPSDAWWSVIYRHPDHMAPLCISLHPTQLYSSILLGIIFLIMYFVAQHRVKTTGVLTCMYLLFVAAERFIVDFWRWDQTWLSNSGLWSLFSANQWVALLICFGAICGILVKTTSQK